MKDKKFNFSDYFNKFLMFCDKRKLIIIPTLIIIAAILPLLGFSTYIVRLMCNILIYSSVGMALNLLVGYTGLVSLGNVAFFCIGAYTSAILSANVGWNFFATLPVVAVTAAIGGMCVGLPTLRLSGPFLSITALGFAEVVRLIAMNWMSLTNGPLGIRNIPRPSIFGLELDLFNKGMFYALLVLVLLITLFVYLLVHSKYGRALRAIKNDEIAAGLMGIKTGRFKIMAFVICAILSGIVGAFYASMMQYIEPNSFIQDNSILTLSVVVVGGMGTLRGPYLGAIILILLPEILRGAEGLRFVIYGLALVLMMRFRPQGILGWKSPLPYKMPKLRKGK